MQCYCLAESDSSSMNSDEASVDSKVAKDNADDKYMDIMKSLQFGKFSMFCNHEIFADL